MKFIFSLLALCNLAWAGDGAGNGDAVRCVDNSSESRLEILDFFENERAGGPPVSLGDSSLSVTDKALVGIGRLKTLDPDRYARYAPLAKDFLSKTRWVKGPLFDYKDTGAVDLPAGCHLEQVALQRPAVDPSDKPFTIDSERWANLIDDNQRAGIIIHEIIYRDTIRLGQQTSRYARKFTAQLASNFFETISAGDYGVIARETFQPHSPHFAANVIQLSVPRRLHYELNLLTLLEKTPGHPLSWGVTSDMPGWLHLDSENQRLFGEAPDLTVEKIQFDLVVRDEEGQALALVELAVI
jgi:hypothetical protein